MVAQPVHADDEVAVVRPVRRVGARDELLGAVDGGALLPRCRCRFCPSRGGARSAGAGVALALPTATLLLSVRRTKPVVTTRSFASTPLLTTVWVSSCFCTAIGRIATVLSSLTT